MRKILLGSLLLLSLLCACTACVFWRWASPVSGDFQISVAGLLMEGVDHANMWKASGLHSCENGMWMEHWPARR